MNLDLNLTVLDEEFCIAKLPSGNAIPAWATVGQFFSITHSVDELSIVCPQKSIPNTLIAEMNWRCLRVEGPLDFGMVGILSGLSKALADAGVSIFAISTYSTDYILVKSDAFLKALLALEAIGCHFTNKRHRIP